jgi:hypothetical protein
MASRQQEASANSRLNEASQPAELNSQQVKDLHSLSCLLNKKLA